MDEFIDKLNLKPNNRKGDLALRLAKQKLEREEIQCGMYITVRLLPKEDKYNFIAWEDIYYGFGNTPQEAVIALFKYIDRQFPKRDKEWQTSVKEMLQ